MRYKTKMSKEEIRRSIIKNTQEYSFSNLYIPNHFLSEIKNDNIIYLYYTGTKLNIPFFCYKLSVLEEENITILYGKGAIPRNFKVVVLSMSIAFTIVWLYFCISVPLYILFIPIFTLLGIIIRNIVMKNMQNAKEIEMIEDFIKEKILCMYAE